MPINCFMNVTITPNEFINAATAFTTPEQRYKHNRRKKNEHKVFIITNTGITDNLRPDFGGTYLFSRKEILPFHAVGR